MLPFVDEKRLFDAIKPLYKYLTPQEQMRNELGSDRLYIGEKNPSFDFVRGLYDRKVNKTVETKISMEGMQGTIFLSEDNVSIGG